MRHRKFCEKFIAALRASDWSTIGPMLTSDFEVVEAAGLPYRGSYRGVDGWKQLSNAILSTWSKFKLGPPEILGETQDSLVVRFEMQGRSRRTGTAFETTVLELWRFRDDKLVRVEPHYFDTHLLAMADMHGMSPGQDQDP